MNIGIIGYGYWGPILASAFKAAGHPVCAVADRHPEHIAKALETYPHAQAYGSAEDLLQDASIEAVVIALPVGAHYPICKEALLQGKHVLVEKPFTYTAEQAAELSLLASERNLTLMVDHHFIYKDSFRDLKAMIGEGKIGTPKFAQSSRLNLGLFRKDCNVVGDLLPHDLSILKFLLDEDPVEVSAKGSCTVAPGIVDTAHVDLGYRNGFTAHIHLSWVYPCKVRDFYIGGDRGVILHNDNHPTEKMTFLEAAYEQSGNRILCSGKPPVTLPPDTSNALANVAAEFVRCVNGEGRPLSDDLFSTHIIHTLEYVQKSLENGGETLCIPPCPPTRNILRYDM